MSDFSKRDVRADVEMRARYAKCVGEPSMRGELNELLDRCSPDELESFLYLARRVDKARAVYGALDLDSDTRDWDAEIRAEHADALAYEMFKRVQESKRR